MNLNSLYRFFRDRLFSYRSVIVLCVVLIQPIPVFAQFKFREAPNRKNPESLSDYDEQKLWSDFLSARSLGKFSLVGTLRYRPARDTSILFDFQLSGDWNAAEQTSVLQLSDSNGNTFLKRIVIRDEKAYLLEETGEGIRERFIDNQQLSNALVSGLPFTWNDILMPYFRWENVTYLGPLRYLGRPAHQFVLINDDSLASASKVIVTLDEDFAVLLKSDVLDKDDNVLKRIRISGFKQFNDVWMFSELVWEHRISRESVLLKASDFSLVP